MANHRNRFPARRRFLKQSTALTATVVALPLPALANAEPADEPCVIEQKQEKTLTRDPAQRRRRDAKR
jgi:hypothetical protein